ncbi:MAG: inorganic diphosphatase [Thermomicrobiales bacterium]
MAASRAISTLSTGDEAPRIVNVVIEIPRGSATKYEYDERLDALRIDGENRSTLPFPADYGFIPRARSEDGDLLDIFVLGGGRTAPGTVIRARPIGVLDMADHAGRDRKIIGVAVGSGPLRAVTEIGDLVAVMRDEIDEFLRAYKRQNNQCLTLHGWQGRAEAHATIDLARARYERPG